MLTTSTRYPAPRRQTASLLRGVLGVGFAVCLLPAAHGQTSGAVLGVYSARIQDDTTAVYGIIRQIHDYPLSRGTVLAVQVTAASGEASTAARRQAGAQPCQACTATHYFLVREAADARPKPLIHAPGPVTYIHVDGREYMLGSVRLAWPDEGGPRLERATLMQTGFAPPLFKRRIRIRFDDPVELGPRADRVVEMATADMLHIEDRARQGSP